MKLFSISKRITRSGHVSPPLQVFLVLVAALGSGLGAAYWLMEGRTQKFYGYVHERTTTILAPRGGVIAQVELTRGQPVEPGTPIARLADENLTSRLHSKKSEIAALQAQVERAKAQAEFELAKQLKEVDEDIWKVKLLAADYEKEKYDFELRKNVLTDALEMNRLAMFGGSDDFLSSLVLQPEESSDDRVITVLRKELAENGAEVSAAQVEWCEWNRGRLESLRNNLPDVIRRSAGVDVLAAQLDQAQWDLSQLESAHEDLEIKSAVVGRAGLLKVAAGTVVAQGEPIVDVLDNVERVVVVYVPSEQILKFREGKEVRLTFAGHQDRRGRITQIAPQAELPPGCIGQESYVEVRVEACGEVWPEVPAMTRIVVRVPTPILDL